MELLKRLLKMTGCVLLTDIVSKYMGYDINCWNYWVTHFLSCCLLYVGYKEGEVVTQNALQNMADNKYAIEKAELHGQLYKIGMDLMDMSDEELVGCRSMMLERISQCMLIISDDDKCTENTG